MSAAQRYTGSNLVVHFITTDGTATLTGDGRNLEVTREYESADVTAGADGARTYKKTLQNMSATFEALFIGENGTASHTIAALGAEGTLLYYPGGTATGKPKGGFPCFISKKDESYPFDDAAIISMEFMSMGAPLFDPNEDVV